MKKFKSGIIMVLCLALTVMLLFGCSSPKEDEAAAKESPAESASTEPDTSTGDDVAAEEEKTDADDAADEKEATKSAVIVKEEDAAADDTAQADGEDEAAAAEPVYAEITMQDGGVITLELDPSAAPVTVDNFVMLVEEGFYDGLTFHRVIRDFMIQGGDPDGNGTGGSEETIFGEFEANGWKNPISHEAGVISMARLGNDPDSASSQFFIVHADAIFLDGEYAAFGHVVKGMEVVDAIANVQTDGSDMPVEPVVIESVKIVDAADVEAALAEETAETEPEQTEPVEETVVE